MAVAFISKNNCFTFQKYLSNKNSIHHFDLNNLSVCSPSEKCELGCRHETPYVQRLRLGPYFFTLIMSKLLVFEKNRTLLLLLEHITDAVGFVISAQDTFLTFYLHSLTF
jgi:hypothetical protein